MDTYDLAIIGGGINGCGIARDASGRGLKVFLAEQGELPDMILVSVHSTVRVRDFTQTDWPQAWIGGGGAATFMRLPTGFTVAPGASTWPDRMRPASGPPTLMWL